MFIKNISQLLLKNLEQSQLDLREIGLQALEKSISAVRPRNLMQKAIKVENNVIYIEKDQFNLHKYNKIYIIGGGKAVAEMVLLLEEIFRNMKDIEYNGIINILKGTEKQHNFKRSKIVVNYASHPIPNEIGLNGTKSMMKLIEKSNKNDLIFCLISGGGSALLPLPKRGVSLENLQKVNSLLLSSGATIHEINTIRKHLSDFKGGNLAKKIYELSGCTLITLIMSDVVGDNLDSIASGPTVADRTTFKDAIEIIEKYNLLEKIPNSVKKCLEKGLSDLNLENPKSNDSCFLNVHNYLIGSVKSAVQDIRLLLLNKGFEANYYSDNIIGEAKEYGKALYGIISKNLDELYNKNNNLRIALIGSGELTVTIKGNGTGGRNQEMLLSFLNSIKDITFDYNFLVIGANLDGIEGNSKAMGALIDNSVLEQIITKNINLEHFLDRNDSNSFFKEMGTEIISGPTGCNVNDLILILLSK
ncbi:MAG: glycerate kinase [Promethearchaeota archaeon]